MSLFYHPPFTLTDAHIIAVTQDELIEAGGRYLVGFYEMASWCRANTESAYEHRLDSAGGAGFCFRSHRDAIAFSLQWKK